MGRFADFDRFSLDATGRRRQEEREKTIGVEERRRGGEMEDERWKEGINGTKP